MQLRRRPLQRTVEAVPLRHPLHHEGDVADVLLELRVPEVAGEPLMMLPLTSTGLVHHGVLALQFVEHARRQARIDDVGGQATDEAGAPGVARIVFQPPQAVDVLIELVGEGLRSLCPVVRDKRLQNLMQGVARTIALKPRGLVDPGGNTEARKCKNQRLTVLAVSHLCFGG